MSWIELAEPGTHEGYDREGSSEEEDSGGGGSREREREREIKKRLRRKAEEGENVMGKGRSSREKQSAMMMMMGDCQPQRAEGGTSGPENLGANLFPPVHNLPLDFFARSRKHHPSLEFIAQTSAHLDGER